MVFNSLGSNYDLKFATKSLLTRGVKSDEKKLISYLENKYSGRVVLLYKGREAIKLVLKTLPLPYGSKVGITGFTCYVVYQAVKEAGYKPIFLDIDNDSLNFSIKELKKQKGLKALIIQNTLGIPVDMDKIKNHCNKKSIYLIEDLAHSIGTVYNTGEEAGTVGDFTALSFSQDKSIDAVSGGALIIRDTKFSNIILTQNFKNISTSENLKNRLYPIFTFIIRKTYKYFLGKVLHFLLKKLNLLSTPVTGIKTIEFHKLPYWNSKLALTEFSNLERTLKHRKKIASIYKKNLNTKPEGVLRWPVLVKNRTKFIGFMKYNSVFISDIWYDSPVAPKNFLDKTDYIHGSCKTSEKISNKIVNLPTHINISPEKAHTLSVNVKKWLDTN